MYIFIDAKIPQKAKEELSKKGTLLELSTKNTVYPEISGHPDIFCTQYKNQIIAAPFLIEKNFFPKDLKVIKGSKNPGFKYPQSAVYNAVLGQKYLIHNLNITESQVLKNYPKENRIFVKQGYCRCNLLSLNENTFISSDLGISKVLKGKGFKIFYIDPSPILLKGFKNGFFGGCTGILEDEMYILGSLKFLKEELELRAFIKKAGLEIVELYNGALFDGGSIIFAS